MTSTDSPAMPRTDAQVREHYELEKQLARQLMAAQRDERRHLYSALYDELFRRLPHHPQWARKASEAQTQRSNRLQFARLVAHVAAALRHTCRADWRDSIRRRAQFTGTISTVGQFNWLRRRSRTGDRRTMR